ncbi:MAG: GGDEF domain-containing protein [Pseudomonadota bacterium]|nr:GGDEF domain-containing protein [Pseudomonadota bacterium]
MIRRLPKRPFSARAANATWADPRRSVLCDEVQAIGLRRGGESRASALLQDEIDQRVGLPTDPMYRFLASNSRGITAKLLGKIELALRHFYAAIDGAIRTGWVGPRITATSNLAGYHGDLFNFEDARSLTEKSLAEARAVGAQQVVSTAAINLIQMHHALGDVTAARAMVDFITEQEGELTPGVRRRGAPMLALAHLGVGEIDLAMQHLENSQLDDQTDGDGVVLVAWVKARCLLARGEAHLARQLAEDTLRVRQAASLNDQPYDLMSLHRALSDACEQAGDAPAALAAFRVAHQLYEQLAGRSARARFIALEVGHQLKTVQHERDAAIDFGRSADDDRRRLTDLNNALQAQMAETEMLHLKLREQALRDPLTSLHNRRHLFATAPGLVELARRQGTNLCVVLMDLDHFKLLNDTYGHDAGDRVLQAFATLLTQTLRRSDIVVRHGGEEFVAVMPDIDFEGAQAMVQRLLQAFQAEVIDNGRRRLPRGSFSAGIAVFPRHGQTLEQLLSRADRGLYTAKHHGRARIEMAPPTGFGTLV